VRGVATADVDRVLFAEERIDVVHPPAEQVEVGRLGLACEGGVEGCQVLGAVTSRRPDVADPRPGLPGQVEQVLVERPVGRRWAERGAADREDALVRAGHQAGKDRTAMTEVPVAGLVSMTHSRPSAATFGWFGP